MTDLLANCAVYPGRSDNLAGKGRATLRYRRADGVTSGVS